MKKLIGIIAFTLIVAGVHAQEIQRSEGLKQHEEKHGRHQNKMFDQLQLTPDQQQQLKASRDGYHEQLKALKSNESITVKDAREQALALRKAQKEKFDAILTKEQKDKLVSLKKEARANHEKRSAERLEKMKSELQLTDAQYADLKNNRAAASKKMDAIRNSQLSETDKRNQIREMKKLQHEQFKKVLTPGQMEKMKTMRGGHKDHDKTLK